MEAEITKGKYRDHDTFIGHTADESMKQYLEARRKGLINRRIPREEIIDESPLIRGCQTKTIRSIGEKQLYRLVQMESTVKQNHNGGCDLKVHSNTSRLSS